MKVLLVRIGALVTLVVLGWLAIAQAQRGGDGTDGPPAPAIDGNVNPLRASSSQATPPAAGTPQDGPLRQPPSDDPFASRKRPARRPDATDSAAGRTTATSDGSGNAGPSYDVRVVPTGHDQDAPANGNASAASGAVVPLSGMSPASNLANGNASAASAASGPALTAADLDTPPDNRHRPATVSDLDDGSTIPPAPRSRDGQPAKPKPVFGRPAGTAEANPPYQPVAQYSASNDRAGVSATREPAPFRPDPFATPTAPARSASDDPPASNSAGDSDFGEPAPEGEGTGQPGSRQLEGAQTPQLTIHKSAPREIQVGKPAVFRVTVRNTGLTAAAQVEIRDRVPRGTRLLGTSPQAKRDANGELAWTLGTIRSGEEAFVEMQVMPLTEGEIGSVATVHFGADASVRTVATRPQLAVETSAPGQVLIGEQVMLTITVSNPGTGVATNVVLAERIPRGLQHPAGGELEYTVGNLKPGESRRLDLPLMAKRPGPVTNRLVARADGNLRAVAERELEVLAPQLNIVMEGSKKRFLERQATYQVSVANSGTAPARQVELAVLLPPGLKFLSANNAGRFDEATRVVHWRLEELPAKETGSVELRTMPVAAGQHAIRLRGTAEKGLLVEKEHPVTIDGIANAQFQVINVNNPVAVGDETVYEVHVTNQGSKAAANVRLDVLFPPELKPLAAEGPTRYALDAGRVVFDGLAQIAPKDEAVYRIRAKALSPADARVRFQLLTDEMQTPLTKEERTRVFADD